MVMDYLSSGYTAPARYLVSGNDTVAITWYRAAPGATVYTLPHAFGSTVWDEVDDIADTGPGEMPGVRIHNPSTPFPLPGFSTPTPPEYLLRGLPANLAVTPCWDGAVILAARFPDSWCLTTEDDFHLVLEDDSGCIRWT